MSTPHAGALAAHTLRHLVLVNALSFLAQVVQISTVPALLALKLNAAGVSSLSIGIVAAAPWAAILLFGRRVPAVLRHLGFVRTNALAAVLALGATLVLLFGQQLALLWAANFVFGCGLILRWIACDTWVVSLAPPHYRGRAIGTHETLMGLGIAAGPLVLGFTGTAGLWPLVACAVLLAMSGALLLLLAAADDHPPLPVAGGLGAMFKIMPVALAAGFLAGFIETSSVSFLPLQGERGLVILSATAVLLVFGIGGTLLQVPLGWLADGIGFRRAQVCVAVGVLCGALGMLAFSHQLWPLAVAVFVFGGAAGGLNTLAVVEAGQTVAEDSVSTAMMSVAMAYTIGSFSGPVATGFAIRAHPAAGLSLTIAAGALLFLLLWVQSARRDRRRGVLVEMQLSDAQTELRERSV